MVLARGWAAAVALGPGGFGAWSALGLIFDYGSYASLGALQGLDLALPGAVAAHDTSRARRLMTGAWGVVLAGGAAFVLGVAALLVWAPRPAALGQVGPALLMLVAVALQLAFQYLTTALRAYGRFAAVSQGQAIQAAAGAALGIALVWPLGLWGLLWGWIAGSLLALLFLKRACPEAPAVPAAPGEGFALTRLGLPIFAYYMTSLVLRSADRAALVRYGNPHQLGLYGVGLMASGLVLFLPESAAYVLFPRIAAAYHGPADRAQARAATLRTQRALAVTLPLLVGVATLWAGPAVRALLPGYLGAILPLRILAAGALALGSATVPSYFLLACGRQRALLVLGAVAAVLDVALVFAVAAREPDPARVALAASAGMLLFSLLILIRAAGELLEPGASRVRFVLSSLFPAAWAVALVFAAMRLISQRGAMGAFVASDLFALGYLPVLIAMGKGLGMGATLREALTGRGRQ
jgi:O-antigen/teichoic acid export membrane protein